MTVIAGRLVHRSGPSFRSLEIVQEGGSFLTPVHLSPGNQVPDLHLQKVRTVGGNLGTGKVTKEEANFSKLEGP